MPFFKVQNLTSGYAGTPVIRSLHFELNAGETLAILGRSGCGKTTLLKALAGLHPVQSGEVLLQGSRINELKPQERGIVYLYQEALLFPHLNVFENIAFGLRLRKESESVVRTRTNALLEKLELAALTNSKPDQLSGGQKQRVAFGRALNVQPPVMLLDEPFGNLDVETRANMQTLYKRMASDHQITALFVTHDLKEAVLMGDRLGYMEDGALTHYADLQGFIADRRTGMAEEMAFWEQVQSKK